MRKTARIADEPSGGFYEIQKQGRKQDITQKSMAYQNAYAALSYILNNNNLIINIDGKIETLMSEIELRRLRTSCKNDDEGSKRLQQKTKIKERMTYTH